LRRGIVELTNGEPGMKGRPTVNALRGGEELFTYFKDFLHEAKALSILQGKHLRKE